VTTCRCCKGVLGHPGWGPQAFKVCATCGSGFLPQEAKAYDASYFDGSAGVDYEDSKRQMQLINRGRLDWIAALAPQPGKLLELGCALGFFLEAAEERGWEGWGIEISPFAAAKAQERFAGRVLAGTLAQAPPAWRDFDLAGGFHVLEHVPDPGEVLRDLQVRLKPGALLAWEVPDFGSRKARRAKEAWTYFLPGEHLNYFTVEGLKHLHEACGFELVFVKRCSFTRLLGGVDRAGLRGLREFILGHLKWFAWAKSWLLWARGLFGSHDCIFVIFRKRSEA
jgi:SAM-dependent methyltransferase